MSLLKLCGSAGLCWYVLNCPVRRSKRQRRAAKSGCRGEASLLVKSEEQRKIQCFWTSSEELVPTFDDPRDRQALEILAELFPGRRVVGIHGVDLVLGLGTLHCMTQQEPA